mmetsp:Transcript_21665/g.50984  ORF Transcript_21665/g.50984 Transcript_21665/m.50984 type:complete len:412 (-) Transcript_21665:92-1327(-)
MMDGGSQEDDKNDKDSTAPTELSVGASGHDEEPPADRVRVPPAPPPEPTPPEHADEPLPIDTAPLPLLSVTCPDTDTPVAPASEVESVERPRLPLLVAAPDPDSIMAAPPSEINADSISQTKEAPKAIPVATRPESLPADFLCSICMNIQLDPFITSCDHCFCGDCIKQALQASELCPVCRTPQSAQQIKPINGCLKRVYSTIEVRCCNHKDGCLWKGSIADFVAHTDTCQTARTSSLGSSALREEVNRLNKENKQLQNRLMTVEATRDQLEEEIDFLRAHVIPKFNGDYLQFRSDNVDELSKLIANNLYECPVEVDRNRIYNVVRARYNDLKRPTSEPDEYWIDMRMLLSTCLACDWFSDRQHDNMSDWYDEFFAGPSDYFDDRYYEGGPVQTYAPYHDVGDNGNGYENR